MTGANNGSTAVVMTVLGPLPVERFGVTDAHNHLWIDAVPGSAADSPVLDQAEAIRAELLEYHAAGGSAIVDCQPGGCGRNGARLAELSRASQVQVIACTGFHRRRYYPPEFGLWSVPADEAAANFIGEIRQGLKETRSLPEAVRAGFIKVACEASLADTPLAALEGAAFAAAETGAAVEIHTERGQAAEDILRFFTERHVAARQVILCHMDKRPDLGLHRELAQAGALLEYDTFFRPKYHPDENVWPLIAQMAAAGWSGALALATDIAEAALWRNLGGGPGLSGLLTIIQPRLAGLGLGPEVNARLLGGNIIERLAGAGID